MGIRRRVGVIGATGAVGQRFVQRLADHPWFEVVALMASPRSVGQRYRDAAQWILPDPIPEAFGDLEVLPTKPDPDLDLVFSAVGADIATDLEAAWAKAGVSVFSNARSHRMDADVPLVIPEVNADHLKLLEYQRIQRGWPDRGSIVTNANCSSTFLTMALAPLHQRFGVRRVLVTTLQALSGAGMSLPALRVHGNVVPFIGGEEGKLESEPLKMLGLCDGQRVTPANFVISAQVNRVPIVDGHTEAISLELGGSPSLEDVVATLEDFRSVPQELDLPSAPKRPIVVMTKEDRPQPSLDLGIEDGMATLVGRIRPCPILGWKFTLLGHNTIRGAASGSLLNAELACAQGWT